MNPINAYKWLEIHACGAHFCPQKFDYSTIRCSDSVNQFLYSIHMEGFLHPLPKFTKRSEGSIKFDSFYVCAACGASLVFIILLYSFLRLPSF